MSLNILYFTLLHRTTCIGWTDSFRTSFDQASNDFTSRSFCCPARLAFSGRPSQEGEYSYTSNAGRAKANLTAAYIDRSHLPQDCSIKGMFRQIDIERSSLGVGHPLACVNTYPPRYGDRNPPRAEVVLAGKQFGSSPTVYLSSCQVQPAASSKLFTVLSDDLDDLTDFKSNAQDIPRIRQSNLLKRTPSPLSYDSDVSLSALRHTTSDLSADTISSMEISSR